MKESSAVDASGLGEQPPSTTTLEELSFSEQVPSSTRMSLREEIMDQKMDSELEEIQSKVKAHRLQDRIPGQSFKVFHPDTAKAMHLQGQELWSGEPDPQRQARLEAKRREQKQLQEEVVENQAEVLTYLQAGMHSVPENEVRSAAFLREANMMDLRQLLKRKYSEGKAFGIDEMFEKARTDIASAREANLESQRVGAESTKRFKPAILPAHLWPADFQSKLENGLFCPLEETPASQIQNEKQYLQRYLEMKALINTGKNPFASELLEEIPDFEVELVSSDTAAGAQSPGTAPEGTEPLSEEAKRLGMLRWACIIMLENFACMGAVGSAPARRRALPPQFPHGHGR